MLYMVVVSSLVIIVIHFGAYAQCYPFEGCSGPVLLIPEKSRELVIHNVVDVICIYI